MSTIQLNKTGIIFYNDVCADASHRYKSKQALISDSNENAAKITEVLLAN